MPVTETQLRETLASIGLNVFNRLISGLTKTSPENIIKDQNILGRNVIHVMHVDDLVDELLFTRFRTSRDTILGNEMEELIWLFIKTNFDGHRVEKKWGIDFECSDTRALYLIQIKSGPNWANSDQKKKLNDNFKRRIRYHRDHGYRGQIKCILGIINLDPKEVNKSTSLYTVLAGPTLFEFLSQGDPELFYNLPNYTDPTVSNNYRECLRSLRYGLTDILRSCADTNNMVNYSALLRLIGSKFKRGHDEVVGYTVKNTKVCNL